uniref:Cell division coordinator CpoB n=1 Tax=Candidatus Kentrum sp. MB TaxID=2138164 RepID=A0A450XDK2_9GAMM|nr:MAG: tol-pal system protein YbgF [Candidatus Kentron sp. MB]VFK30303.1 MAG: tol-pal system protein YbgF [Candidatus Kentron sp. MB]VFK74282.1 MAG: tol-pal system protein YbgF [Candidatus Kentron sp. MB]
MRTVSTRLTAAFLCVLLFGVLVEPVVGSGAIQERLDQMERVMGSRALMDLLDRVDDMQREIRELRGQVEIQAHALSQIKKSQRNYYLDLDNRLRHVAKATGVETEAPIIDTFTTHPSPTREPDVATPAAPPKKSVRQSVNDTPPDSQSDRTNLQRADPYTDTGQDAAYRKAFELLRRKSYGQATVALTAFLERYPNSQYAEDAQYWLGETYYVTRQFKPALSTFEKFLHRYPASAKTSDALLKIGYVQHELGQKAKAKRTFANLIQQYPGSTQAHLAQKRLRNRSKTP